MSLVNIRKTLHGLGLPKRLTLILVVDQPTARSMLGGLQDNTDLT